MRSLSLVIFALALATGFAAPAGNGTENKVQDLIDAYIDFGKRLSVKADPLKLKDLPTIPIVTVIPPVAILLSSVNRTVSRISDNIVSGEVVVNNTAQFRITYPDVRGESDYKVGGIYLGRRIYGAGHATIDMLNVTVDVNVTFRNVNVRWPLNNATYLQIAELSEVVSVGSLSSNFTGLNIDGWTPEEANKVLNDQAQQTLDLNLPWLSRLISQSNQCQLNLALVGSSIDDAINWLKKNTAQESHLRSLIPDIF